MAATPPDQINQELLQAAQDALSVLSDYPVAALKGYVPPTIKSLIKAIAKAKGLSK